MGNAITCANRIKEALATHLPTSAMSPYCNGTLTPRQKRTQIIADALSVSVGWLMGFDVPSEPDVKIAMEAVKNGLLVEPPVNRNDIPNECSKLSDEASELLRIYQSLNIKGRTKLLAFAYELESQKEE
jgi:hypothetical protein